MRALTRYISRWAPYWAHCALTGLALGTTIGVSVMAVHDLYVAPVWVVALAAALRQLHASKGTTSLTKAARKALGRD